MKNKEKKKIGRRTICVAVFFLLLVLLYVPRPLSIARGCQVDTILYRAPDWETLHYYYPIQGEEQQLDQQALKKILKKAWVVPHLLPFEMPQSFPQGGVTYFITLSNSGENQTLLLGDMNQRKTKVFGNYVRYYTILNAEEIMEELDDCLKPDEKENLVPIA